MFTIQQIELAHSKVKSGSDFPSYIKEIRKIGVLFYEVFVENGHTDYFGENKFQISSSAKYPSLKIANTSNCAVFKACLIDHQKGKTNYLNFCNDCAKSGIEKWSVNLKEMTCTYYDKAGNKILVETIPV